MRKKDKIKLLEFETTNMTIKIGHLRNKIDNMANYINQLETLLKCTLNEATECNKKISELKIANHLLEEQLIYKEQLLEEKEHQRRKAIGKVSSLIKKLNKIEKEKEGQNEIIKSFVKETRQLKDLVKTNKDARTYLKGKSEHE